jgi:histidine phosphotransferase ChpT
MLHSDAKLAALIGSRICHDLISPIGAINNGLELLGMTNAAEGPELELISESVGNASARIRFFRIAFGAAGAQMIGQTEATGILMDLMSGGRVSLQYRPSEAQPRHLVRLAFLSILCLEDALPYGGEITVECEGDHWTLRGTSEKMNLDNALWSLLVDPRSSADVAPSQVHFVLLSTLAREDGIKLQTALTATSVEIRFRAPA